MKCTAQLDTPHFVALPAMLLVAACMTQHSATERTLSPDAALSDAGGHDHVSRDASTQPSPVLSASLEGDWLGVDVRGGTFYQQSCSGAVRAEKSLGGQWIPLQDDRADSRWYGYYLDGVYVAADRTLGCDVVACERTQARVEVGAVNEYVRTGSMAPPAGTGALPGFELAVIETRAFHGQVRVHLVYSSDATCSDAHEANVLLDVPEHGVCCPIGKVDCSSQGPGGGWAPTPDACSKWPGGYPYGAFVVRETDVRGCPKLVVAPDACCACPLDGPDAGL